jgi:preprotein translocase subunit YajC
MLNLTILLAEQPAQGQGSAMSTLLMFVGIIVIFYFFMIRPQQKRQKDLRKQRESMGKGDNVVTAGGIFGKIREVREDSFIIEVDNNVKIRVDKNSVYPSAAEAAADAQQK